MEQYLESRIVLDETDWAIRFGSLQLAHALGIESWRSRDGQYSFRSIAAIDPFEGIPSYDNNNDVAATIPDPEFITGTFETINPSNWLIIRTLYTDFVESVQQNKQIQRQYGIKNRTLKPLPCTVFNIDETVREISVVDCPDGMFGDLIMRLTPNFRDISEICDALDDLTSFLSR
jgi:hypothetical protein